MSRQNAAGSESPETTIAQARLFFLFQDGVEILPEFSHRRARGLLYAEVDEVVSKMRTHE